MQTLVIFDIGDTPLRTRVAAACKDAGLRRAQYSAYLGECGEGVREELKRRLIALVEGHADKEDEEQRLEKLHIQVFLIGAADFDRAYSIFRDGVSPVSGFEQPDVAVYFNVTGSNQFRGESPMRRTAPHSGAEVRRMR